MVSYLLLFWWHFLWLYEVLVSTASPASSSTEINKTNICICNENANEAPLANVPPGRTRVWLVLFPLLECFVQRFSQMQIRKGVWGVRGSSREPWDVQSSKFLQHKWQHHPKLPVHSILCPHHLPSHSPLSSLSVFWFLICFQTPRILQLGKHKIDFGSLYLILTFSVYFILPFSFLAAVLFLPCSLEKFCLETDLKLHRFYSLSLHCPHPYHT